MIVGVPTETFPGERRVALVPALLPLLKKAGLEVVVERDAGASAGFPDALYREQGGRIVETWREVFEAADVVLQVRTAGANPTAGQRDLALVRSGQTIIGFAEPLSAGAAGIVLRGLAGRGVTTFAIELMPRITRAQSMDALSSMATIAGYKAVLLAATTLPRLFPMLITAAGTVAAARVFIVGAGVAGLQAIATARRLGAKVEAFDVRPAVKEQVQSLGARFAELPGISQAADAEDQGGYARAQEESFYRRQREMMARVVAGSDVVITTALVPGKKAPILITADMIAGMAPGSVVVDIAAERGGNCELTRPDEAVVVNGVTILGPTNLPSTVPYHASQMYAKNLVTFLLHLVKDGALHVDTGDEITRETLVTRGGEIVHPRVRDILATTVG